MDPRTARDWLLERSPKLDVVNDPTEHGRQKLPMYSDRGVYTFYNFCQELSAQYGGKTAILLP